MRGKQKSSSLYMCTNKNSCMHGNEWFATKWHRECICFENCIEKHVVTNEVMTNSAHKKGSKQSHRHKKSSSR